MHLLQISQVKIGEVLRPWERGQTLLLLLLFFPSSPDERCLFWVRREEGNVNKRKFRSSPLGICNVHSPAAGDARPQIYLTGLLIPPLLLGND